MESYLQHLKFLREHRNDHEDRVASLSADHSEHETHIQYLQIELDSARAETIRVENEVEALSKENDDISKLIISCQEKLETIGAASQTLSQASELMDENLRKKGNHILESKSSYESLETEARSQLDKFQAQCESLKRATEDTNASLAKATEKAPVTAPKPSVGVAAVFEDEEDQGRIIADVDMAEADNNMVGARLRLEQLQEEAKRAEEDLRKITAENDQLEAGFETLQDSLREMAKEKLAEEDFMQKLHNHLQQLKDYCQDVACADCQHAYVIEWNGLKFVIRSA